MDVDDAQLHAPACEAAPAVQPAEERDRGATASPRVARGGQPEREPTGAGLAAADDGVTRRNAQRRGGVGTHGDALGPGETLNASLRHASRSPPKKVPRWRGRSGRGGGPHQAPGAAAEADVAMHPAGKGSKGLQTCGRGQAEAASARRSSEATPLRAASGYGGGNLAGARAAAAGASSKAHAAVALLRFQVEQGSIDEVRCHLL